MFSDESIKIARSLEITEFKSSSTYIKQWKNRFDMLMQKSTNKSQKLPMDYAVAVAVFLKVIHSYRIKNDYISCNISNMDQTMVHSDEPYGRTNVFHII